MKHIAFSDLLLPKCVTASYVLKREDNGKTMIYFIDIYLIKRKETHHRIIVGIKY